MKLLRRLFTLASILSILTLSTAFSADEPAKKKPVPFDANGDWILKVTHELDQSFFELNIPDNAYKPVKAAKDKEWRFSIRGKVLICKNKDGSDSAGPLIETNRTEDERIYRTKNPKLGDMPQLSLKRTKDGLVGTMTEFGSGIPVLGSWRGVATKGTAAEAKPHE